jgi:hypothetical protein
VLPAIFCIQPGEFTAPTLFLVVDDVPNVEVLFRQQYRMIAPRAALATTG